MSDTSLRAPVRNDHQTSDYQAIFFELRAREIGRLCATIRLSLKAEKHFMTKPFEPRKKLPRFGCTLRLAAALVPCSQIVSAQTVDGERLYQQRCASCHSLEDSGRGAGPTLAGVFGRPAGSVEGARYSHALEEADLVWDAETLDAFLADPREVVPGTMMAVRITDPAQRQAIVSFLEAHGSGGEDP
ncbi:c-type cytochrome [Paroceanicella profunda]|nr:c-type cytochrome [Paroceanicella profunda]